MPWGTTPWDSQRDTPDVFEQLRDCGFNHAGFVAKENLDRAASAGLKALVYDPGLSFGDEMLSGASTPRESMPLFIQNLMLLAPNTHFVIMAQAILYRGAGLAVVWPQMVALAIIGGALFGLSLARFRKFLQ